MAYLHYGINAGNNSVIQVTLDAWANVLLMDDTNYNNYRRGLRHQYYGGLAEVSPYNIRPPHYAHWNVVIDRGGYPGTVRASVRII